MATKSTKTLTFSFGKAQFPSLMCQEFEPGQWHEVGFSSLTPDEQEGLSGLLENTGLTNHADYDPDRILLVKAINGVISEVYGPCIFGDGNNIILKVGTVKCPVTQAGDRITVGSLSGKITSQTLKKSDGTEYPVCLVNLMSPDKVFYRVRIALSPQQPSAADIEACLLGEEANSLLPYLAPVPSGALKMCQLGVGEWLIKAISATQGQYGMSYKLHLASGQVIYATGNSQTILENPSFQFNPEDPLTLKISQIEEVADGKYRVHNALLRRLPKHSSQSPDIKTLNVQYSVSMPITEIDTEIDLAHEALQLQAEDTELADFAF